MPWPEVSACEKAIDLSIYNNPAANLATPALGRVQFQKVHTEHPDIRIVISRAAGAYSGPDPDFAYNFEASAAAGFLNAAYVNQSPDIGVTTLLTWWKKAIGTRTVKVLMLDAETAAGETPAKVTKHQDDCVKALQDTWPDATLLTYLRKTWAMENLLRRSWETDLLVAHYPYLIEGLDGEWRMAYSFDESDAKLPIHNSFTPSLPPDWLEAAGWQFSKVGQIALTDNYPNRKGPVDLSYIRKTFVSKAWGTAPAPAPTPAPAEPVIVTVRVPAGKATVRVEEVQ